MCEYPNSHWFSEQYNALFKMSKPSNPMEEVFFGFRRHDAEKFTCVEKLTGS